ncbi:hypothetical protein BDP55DRAFT_670468 [Colletotrichum godetiae]|uniref:Uncharacterized protein n=1 Tax=Colletotrichum godetiae TaxID=1209918 RepID=A0AAJ0AFY4_9PEZI|nr:uncharacterized protein BDP55DRAFT_670468 [Colletotrichum godetiae]KAK1673181.1 hypothetical protein BDP55DRAFT_670468 [Colletotrichum godetiae]
MYLLLAHASQMTRNEQLLEHWLTSIRLIDAAHLTAALGFNKSPFQSNLSMTTSATADSTSEISDLVKFERSLRHYHLCYGYIAFVNTAVSLYICCMLLLGRPPLNPTGKLRWKKVTCAYFAITWVASPILMIFIQLPLTESRAMRDLMTGSTITVATNHLIVLGGLLNVIFSKKKKDEEAKQGVGEEVVRANETELGLETVYRLSTDSAFSKSIVSIEADSDNERSTENASLLSSFAKNTSAAQVQSMTESDEKGKSAPLEKKSAADSLIPLPDRDTQVSVLVSMLNLLPGYGLMFLPIYKLLSVILEHETVGAELQRQTKDILIFYSVWVMLFIGVCTIIIKRIRSLCKQDDTECAFTGEDEKKKRDALLRLGWKLAIVVFYLLVIMSTVWMQYLVIATIAKDPTGMSHLLQLENLSLAYALVPKLLIFAS